MAQPHVVAHNAELQLCVDACLDCFKACQQMALTHCLQVGGAHVAPEHFRLMLDCAELCRAAATLMLNGSTAQFELCALCARLCRECANSCRKLDGMDECVSECERCADLCERMTTLAPNTK